MNSFVSFSLKCLRHGYGLLFGAPVNPPLPLLSNADASGCIYDLINGANPCMIAKYGANELGCISNYLGIKYGDHKIWKYVKGESSGWWWNHGMMRCMENNAGFFPSTPRYLEIFSEMMLEDSKNLDILAVYSSALGGISKINKYLPNNLKYINFEALDSFIFQQPWTRALKEKNVVVVHPFANLINTQYKKRKMLFENNEVLPTFNLRTIEAVQSIGGVNHGFKDWFEALDWMKKEMDKEPYDIALIGCGAYGFPLAAHAKRTGHQAVHIGGALQLLFGIKGRRWEDPNYAKKIGMPEDFYINLMSNPAWVRPDEYRTKEAENVEDGCYW